MTLDEMEQPAPLAVVVVPYDPAWPEMFERERLAIQAALADLEVAIVTGN